MSAPLTPRDIALLLRSHSEQRWLSREVIPVVRQIETGERLPEDQLPAAIAYLEVIWAEALMLARAADTALHALDTHQEGEEGEDLPDPPSHQRRPRRAHPNPPARLDRSASRCTPQAAPHSQPLPARARRYHAVVQALREAAARRVAALLAPPAALGVAVDEQFGMTIS